MLAENMRRTSVIWSFESNALSKDLIDTIVKEKADALRIVPERRRSEATLEFLDALKASPHDWARSMPLLVDLWGHHRGCIVNLKEARDVSFGDELNFTPPGGGGDFEVDSDEWPDLFALDHSVYIGFGMVVLKPTQVDAKKVTLQVVQGGRFLPDADIHVPFTRKPATLESIPDVAWQICSHEAVDYLIIPSVETVEELKKIKDRVSKGPHQPWLLLKIDSRATYANLDQLLPHVRGVIVSRNDLAMDMDPAQIPMISKEITQKCNQHACLVLIASEMLGSMRYNATPTRAEVSDIANAVFDGADGVILSEALGDGKYLSRGFMLAKRSVVDVEGTAQEYPLNWIKRHPTINNEIEAVTYASYRTAHRNRARAIVCMTKAGNTAFHLRAFGVNVPIIALSTSPEVIRRLKIVKGVQGILLDVLPNIDEVLPLINNLLIKMDWINDNDKYVFVSITLSSVGEEGSNLFTVQSINSKS